MERRPAASSSEADNESKLFERLERVASARGDRDAVRTRHGSIRFDDLARRARSAAAEITRHAGPGEGVAILTRDLVSRTVSIYGALAAGAYYVVLDPEHPGERIRWLVDNSESRVAITDEATAPLARALPGLEIPMVVVEETEGLAFTGSIRRRSLTDPAFLVYTSGSTGKPKGIPKLHRDIVQSLSPFEASSPSRRVSVGHAPGSAFANLTIHLTLLEGDTLVDLAVRDQTLIEIADWLNTEKVNDLRVVSSFFRQLLAAVGPEMSFPSIRHVILGGERVTSRDISIFMERFPRNATVNANLSSTEAGRICFREFCATDPVPDDPIPLGKPATGLEVRLIDESGNRVNQGEVGEVVVVSHRLPSGYWRDPDQSREAFGEEPDGRRSFRTGDLARFLPDGNLVFMGRRDNQLKIRGNRVEPSEVEATLLSHPSIREAAVVGRTDAVDRTYLAAFVVSSESVDRHALRLWLRERIPTHLVPSRIIALDRLPLNSSSKIDHRALETMPIEDSDRTVIDETNRTEDEKLLRAIWCRVLGRADVDFDDDVFDLGADSLMAATAFAEIEKETGIRMQLAALLENPTVVEQARLLREGADSEFDLLVPLRSSGTRPILFLASALGGNIVEYRDLVAALGNDQPVWGLQAHGLDGSADVPTTIDEIAESYANAIRSIQPAGPYYVAGRSIGGMLAYETARKLVASDRDVALVAMLDASGNARRKSVVRRGLVRLRLIAREPLKRIVGFGREYRWRLEKWIEMRERIRARTTGRKVPPHLRGVALVRMEAIRNHRPGPWDGDLLLVRAKWGMRTVLVAEDLGWSGLVSGKVEIHDVPGDHFDFHLGQNASNVASILRDAIDRTLAIRGTALNPAEGRSEHRSKAVTRV